jgi:hypothetical protein
MPRLPPRRIIVPVIGSSSAWDQMQAWSARRAASFETFQSQTRILTASLGGSVSGGDTLSAMLTGGSGSASLSFVSNEALSSALFDYTANILSAEETLVAQKVYTRVMKENESKMAAQQAQFDELSTRLGSLGAKA